MKYNTVFSIEGGVLAEDDVWIPYENVPEGSYLYRQHSCTWYIRMGTSYTPINLSDVPKELKLLVLLLN